MAAVMLPDPDGTRAKLLAVAAEVQQKLPSSVLIGGLAVVSRCERHGRATRDVDTLIDEKDLEHVELATLGEVAGEGRVWVGGVKVDVLDVGALDPDDDIHELVDGTRQQLFVAAHRWALDTNEQLQVGTTGVSAVVALRVASAPALVATGHMPLSNAQLEAATSAEGTCSTSWHSFATTSESSSMVWRWPRTGSRPSLRRSLAHCSMTSSDGTE